MELAKIAAVLTTLDETDGSPESMLYIFFGMDIHLWNDIKAILVKADLITVKSNYVTLTENGKRTAQQLNKVMEPSRENE